MATPEESSFVSGLEEQGDIDGISSRVLWIARPIAIQRKSLERTGEDVGWPDIGDVLRLVPYVGGGGKSAARGYTCTVGEIYVDESHATGYVIVWYWGRGD